MSDKLIMGNMADLMVRELWGAYEHEHKQRVMQLTRVVGCFSEPLLFVEASQTQPWVILHLNEAAVTVTGRITMTYNLSEWNAVCVLGGWAVSCLHCMLRPWKYILESYPSLVRQLSLAQARAYWLLVLFYPWTCGSDT